MRAVNRHGRRKSNDVPSEGDLRSDLHGMRVRELHHRERVRATGQGVEGDGVQGRVDGGAEVQTTLGECQCQWREDDDADGYREFVQSVGFLQYRIVGGQLGRGENYPLFRLQERC